MTDHSSARENPEIEDEAVMDRVRQLVGELLEDDVSPIVIAYAMTYVATELGLRVEPDARRVLSTLLATMAHAASSAVPDETELDAVPGSGPAPARVTKQ